jgi:hypothetical protein
MKLAQGAMTSTINSYDFNNLPVKPDVNRPDRPLVTHRVQSSAALPADQVSISGAARRQQALDQGVDRQDNANNETLGAEKQQLVNDLKQRDAEVKAHEAAHMSVGGTVVQGGASYQYQTGPDGKMYAVGGEVSIDISSENSPDTTIRKMQQVRQAALAPAQPSGTDRAVAAQATQIEVQARIDKSEQAQEAAEADPGPETDASQPVPPHDQQARQPRTGFQINLFV